MYTEKTYTKIASSRISQRFDDLMSKGMETLDAGMKVLDEVFNAGEPVNEEEEVVSTTIRIGLTPERVADLVAGKTLTFKADSATIVLQPAVQEKRETHGK